MTRRDHVLSILMSAAAPITADRIADAVYADDPQGGPVTAANIMRLLIAGLRADGHDIETRKGPAGGYTYRRVVGYGDATRRRSVERLYKGGVEVSEIARTVGADVKTIFADLQFLRGCRAGRIAA